MNIEKLYKKNSFRTIQPKRRGNKLDFVDNRQVVNDQAKLISDIKKSGEEDFSIQQKMENKTSFIYAGVKKYLDGNIKDKQIYYRNGSNMQCKDLSKRQKIIQYAMDPLDVANYHAIPQSAPAFNFNTPQYGTIHHNSGASSGGDVYLTTQQGQSSPVDLVNMDDWKYYETGNLLEDPYTGNTLTRMHIINGTFFGPSQPYNMLLGTQASNNSHPNSHYHAVESPIRDFLNDHTFGFNNKKVYYRVTRDYDTPNYLVNRAPRDTYPMDVRPYLKWIKEACPGNIYCTATFYYNDNANVTYAYKAKEVIPMDL